MTYFIIKYENLYFYIKKSLEDRVRVEFLDIIEKQGTAENESGKNVAMKYADFVVDTLTDDFVKCRYGKHHMINVFSDHLARLNKINDD